MMPSLVSTIVLNWNGKEVIAACLNSLLRQTYQPHEIIVIDNGSTDGSLQTLKEKYASSIQLIENPKNLGFAEAVNQGIQASRGEFIALLNNDAWAQDDWLENLVQGIRRSENIGMAACRIYRTGLERILDNTGIVITRDGLGRGRGRLEKDEGQFEKEEPVLCPSGCAALYRRKMLEEIGFFDPLFFAYGEDVDLGLRGRLLGYDCLYMPKAIAYHQFSSAAGTVSPLKAFYVERNRLWVAIKCFPLRCLAASFFYSFARYFYNFYGMLKHKGPAARYLEKKSLFSLIRIGLQIYFSTLWHLPHLIFRRVQIQSARKVSTGQFKAWLKAHGMSVHDAALSEL